MNEDRLCELMKDSIEAHQGEIKLTDKLRDKADKHMYVTKTLLTHYKID